MRILSGDILIADVIAPLEGNPVLAALVEKCQMKPGGKQTIDAARMEEFSKAVAGRSVTVTPGGSSANMLTTLSKLMGKKVDIRFLGVVGEGSYSDIIKRSLNEAHIALVPERLPDRPLPQAAVSFVMVTKGGQCTIATHPGNARDILKSAMITDGMVHTSDILLVQGSLWNKLDRTFPNRLVALGRKHGKTLWLTLPTQPGFDEEDAAHFQRLIPDADLLLGNDAELVRAFCLPIDAALSELQRMFRENTARRQIGFITCGKTGAAVVTADSIERISPMPINAADIVNTLGAGDTAYAGFAAGLLKGLSPMESAQIAMALAEEKLRINAPRLPDPRSVLARHFPHLDKLLAAV